MVEVEGYKLPDGLLYSKDHMWARMEGDLARVGLTDYGQHIAGKIVFSRMRPKGPVAQGKPVGTIETAKWVGALKSPVTGEISEANPDLKSQPKLINEDPYGKGWLVTVKPSQLETDKANLMPALQAAEWLREEVSKEKKK